MIGQSQPIFLTYVITVFAGIMCVCIFIFIYKTMMCLCHPKKTCTKVEVREWAESVFTCVFPCFVWTQSSNNTTNTTGPQLYFMSLLHIWIVHHWCSEGQVGEKKPIIFQLTQMSLVGWPERDCCSSWTNRWEAGLVMSLGHHLNV